MAPGLILKALFQNSDHDAAISQDWRVTSLFRCTTGSAKMNEFWTETRRSSILKGPLAARSGGASGTVNVPATVGSTSDRGLMPGALVAGFSHWIKRIAPRSSLLWAALVDPDCDRGDLIRCEEGRPICGHLTNCAVRPENRSLAL